MNKLGEIEEVLYEWDSGPMIHTRRAEDGALWYCHHIGDHLLFDFWVAVPISLSTLVAVKANEKPLRELFVADEWLVINEDGEWRSADKHWLLRNNRLPAPGTLLYPSKVVS